nr:MAG TPA_asm: hypothetical protein [Caudoviricetes sp.]
MPFCFLSLHLRDCTLLSSFATASRSLLNFSATSSILVMSVILISSLSIILKFSFLNFYIYYIILFGICKYFFEIFFKFFFSNLEVIHYSLSIIIISWILEFVNSFFQKSCTKN